jgi:hypothetical protein
VPYSTKTRDPVMVQSSLVADLPLRGEQVPGQRLCGGEQASHEDRRNRRYAFAQIGEGIFMVWRLYSMVAMREICQYVFHGCAMKTTSSKFWYSRRAAACAVQPQQRRFALP